jgi:hypothetical protein
MLLSSRTFLNKLSHFMIKNRIELNGIIIVNAGSVEVPEQAYKRQHQR